MYQFKNWKKQVIYIGALVVFFFIVDRILKLFVLQGVSVDIFFIRFSLFENPYIAFSIPFSGILFYIVLSLVLLFVVWNLLLSYKKKRILAVFSLSLVFVGAVSNILDRILYSVVIDYALIPSLFAFNFADLMIVGGVGILIIPVVFKSSRA